MELLKNNAGYAQLFVNLHGHWKTKFKDLPENLKSLTQNKFPRPWDKLDEENKRNLAHQYDCLHDPNQEPATYFKVALLSSFVNEQIKQARKNSNYPVIVALLDVNEFIEDILENDRERVGAEIQTLRQIQLKQGNTPKGRETTYLNIIGALLECISGEAPGVTKHTSFSNQTELIELITEKYKGYDGLSKRSMEGYFPEAKRSLELS